MPQARRVRRIRLVDKNAGMKEAKQLLQSIAEASSEAQRAAARANEATEELQAVMQKYKIDSVRIDEADAEFTQSAGKSQNLVDPAKFHKAVGDKEFYGCVSVSITKARELLPERALAKITTTIPGTAGPVKLKLTLR